MYLPAKLMEEEETCQPDTFTISTLSLLSIAMFTLLNYIQCKSIYMLPKT